MANVLICLSASKYNSRVIDKGAQIAKSNHAVLSAIFVQTPKYEGASAASKSCLRENIKYAESKGAKVTILYGQDVLPQLVEYVGVSQVDCVVLEKNLAKQALFKLKDIDIYSVNLLMCDKEAIEVQKILPFLSDTWPLCRIGRAVIRASQSCRQSCNKSQCPACGCRSHHSCTHAPQFSRSFPAREWGSVLQRQGACGQCP